MKTLILFIVAFFVNIWRFFFPKSEKNPYLKDHPSIGLTTHGSLPVLSPEQVYNPILIHPIYDPPKTKFKPSQRERHLGRRRSRFYFNKNR